MVVRGVILRFDGEGKRLNGAQMKRGNFFSVFFLRRKTGQVSLIRAVNPVNDGKRYETELPANLVVDGAHATGDQRPEQIIGERPQITLFPNVDRIPALGHG